VRGFARKAKIFRKGLPPSAKKERPFFTGAEYSLIVERPRYRPGAF
jgi:hypothetical protein